MNAEPRNERELSEAEINHRREAALKRLLAMPPQPKARAMPDASQKKRGRPANFSKKE